MTYKYARLRSFRRLLSPMLADSRASRHAAAVLPMLNRRTRCKSEERTEDHGGILSPVPRYELLSLALLCAACAACETSSGDARYYCSPFLGIVTASAVADGGAGDATVCGAGTSCQGATANGLVCGAQPDGSSAGDACPAFLCVADDAEAPSD